MSDKTSSSNLLPAWWTEAAQKGKRAEGQKKKKKALCLPLPLAGLPPEAPPTFRVGLLTCVNLSRKRLHRWAINLAVNPDPVKVTTKNRQDHNQAPGEQARGSKRKFGCTEV